MKSLMHNDIMLHTNLLKKYCTILPSIETSLPSKKNAKTIKETFIFLLDVEKVNHNL